MIKTYRILCIFALIAVTLSQLTEKEWWEAASLYQIYPRSFQDASGDGIGDLKGVTKRLPYLKEIGVTATWLSPILQSPMADFGYDISSFYDIDPIFGNMTDFDEMVAVAKELDIKIIMDLVPNHSSDECEWFIKSVAGDPDYKDFYIWHPGKVVNGTRQPPSNWVSVFRGSAWEWNDQRQEYYLHQFHYKQPDLNYRNAKVIEAMKDVMRFWIRKGVYGYRVDAVPHVFEIDMDADGNYQDEPRNYGTDDPENYGYTEHIYTTNQPETIDLMYQFRSVLDELKAEFNEIYVLLLEAYTDYTTIKKYYGNGTVEGAQMPFNFAIISDINENSVSFDYKTAINGWLDMIPEGRTSNWVIGNHDKNRVGSRLGVERIDSMNILISTLPGVMITYNGEEIGMTDGDISWEETMDPQACQGTPEELAAKSRDPERTPMQWNDDKNAGFTTAEATPWLPISNNYEFINVKNQRGIPNSHLNVYKQLKTLRNSVTMIYGDTDVQTPNENVLINKRSLSGHPTYLSVLNLNRNVERINLREIYSDLPSILEYVIVTDKCLRRRRDIISSESLLLMPYEGTVLRTAL